MDYQKLYLILSLLQFLTIANELTFHLEEEVSSGKVVATNSELTPLLANPNTVPLIINRKSPGASSFTFVKRPQSGLELIVSDRVDREVICPSRSTASNGLQIDPSPRSTFHIEDSSRMLPFRSSFHDYGGVSSNPTTSDCIVSLRVASSDKIFNIKIEILDINDNAPTWNTSSIQLSLRDEDPAGTVIYLPLAEDEDVGLNGEITYSLQALDDEIVTNYNNGRRQSGSQLSLFELVKHSDPPFSQRILSQKTPEPKLALRTKTPIDREQLPETIRLLLTARDSGSPNPQQSSLKLIINVTDVNDNAPMFEKSIYKVDILSEDTPVGKTLLQLDAKDMDSGPNAEITYRFEDNGQPMLDVIKHFFEITPRGQLKILRKLNVDKIDGEMNLPSSSPITFGVEATDGASPAYALTGRTTVQIQVSDTNDEAPRIQVYPVRPPKDQPTGSGTIVETTAQEYGNNEQLLALVEVIDPDMDGLDTVECHLKGSAAEYFQLTSTPSSSGKGEYSLMTNARLDRETTPRLEVSIICRDSAGHASRHDVGINLLDVNDNAPNFDKPFYEFYIEENDGEAEVDDGSSPLNDKRPVRGQDGENGVHARDADAGENSRISYHLEPDPRDQSSVSYFSIDQNTGALFAVVPLDREAKGWHKFTVVATDHGEPPLSASVGVLVHVENLNDNVPQFINQLVPEAGYSFSVDENEPSGRFVGQITAVDADDEELKDEYESLAWTHSGNHRVSGSRTNQPFSINRLIYTLGSEPDAALFRIDKYSGNITTRERLDREKQSTYSFQVFVSDGFLPDSSVEASLNQPWKKASKSRIHTMVTSVVVNVIDQNDNRPTFIQPNATNHLILLDPTTTPGKSIMQIIATDADEGENARVTYKIDDGNAGSNFFLAPVEGLLYLNGLIPRRTIEKAIYASETAASNAASISSSLLKKSGIDGAEGVKDDSSEVPAYPTFVLKIEACDAGTPKQCSYFPNLQIQLRVPSDHNGGANGGNLGGLRGQGYGDHSEGSSSGDKDGRPGWVRISLVEQVIIGLTIFFAVVVLIALLSVLLMRGGLRSSCTAGLNSCYYCFCPFRKSDKTVEKMKQTPIVGPIGEPQLHRTTHCRSEEYIGGGGNRNGHFVDSQQGTRVLPAVPFSPVSQTMIECSPYRDCYQLGNQIVYPHPQSTGYGMLGPTTLVNSRHVIGTMQQPTPRRQGEASLDDYQCLDTTVSRGQNVPTSCEAYYQTHQTSGGIWDPRYQVTSTTSWPRNELRLPGASHYVASTANNLNIKDGDDEGDCGSESLELMKNSFPDNYVDNRTDETLPTPPQGLLKQSNSSAAALSRNLNFPKATFV
nr:protocadherin 1 [Hymenolepis microstoma]